MGTGQDDLDEKTRCLQGIEAQLERLAEFSEFLEKALFAVVLKHSPETLAEATVCAASRDLFAALYFVWCNSSSGEVGQDECVRVALSKADPAFAAQFGRDVQ